MSLDIIFRQKKRCCHCQRSLQDIFSKESDLGIADIDEGLNKTGSIVLGLGDAGDLAIGTKL